MWKAEARLRVIYLCVGDWVCQDVGRGEGGEEDGEGLDLHLGSLRRFELEVIGAGCMGFLLRWVLLLDDLTMAGQMVSYISAKACDL